MFGNRFKTKTQEYKKVANYVPMEKPPRPKPDFYRIGVTDDGKTTFTLLDEGGYSMTLTVNSDGVRQIIRLLEATLPLEAPNDETV